MMYTVKPSGRFQKDVRLAQKRGCRMELLTETIKLLANGAVLPERYKNHPLSGNFAGCYECHILPDWLLVYEKNDDTLFLYLTRTGTHSDLF